MRVLILVLAAFSATGLAQAASIDTIKTGGQPVHSIEKIKCDTCVRAVVKKAEPEIKLAPGTQKIEFRTVDGVKKIYRTEAWLGGSPVVFVSKAPATAMETQTAATDDANVDAETTAAKAADLPAEEPASHQANMIDVTETSAVTADMGAEVKVEPKTPAVFDPSKFELRLD